MTQWRNGFPKDRRSRRATKGVGEVDVTPKKLAGLTIISNELADDSDPSALQVVGDGLVRDLMRKLDGAFFSASTPNGPVGIDSVTTSVVGTGGSIANLDAFHEAQMKAEVENATVTAWAANPADVLTLANLKAQTGSNVPLLTPDPTLPTRRQIAGIPVYSSPAVQSGVIWGIPGDRVIVVIRMDYSVEADRSAYFSSDRTGVRAIIRTGFAFPHPLAVVKIHNAP